MIKEYSLQGLNCANCAAKIERAIKNIEGVSYVSVNIATSLLQIDISDSHSIDLHKKVKRIVHHYEPDVTVLEKTALRRVNFENINRKKIARLTIGAVSLPIGLALENFFNINGYIILLVFIFCYLLLGGTIVLRAFKNITTGNFFDENFLMTIATIGAFAIGQYAEAVAVMLFYQIGEFFQDFAVNKSKKTIAKLMDIRPDYANLQIDGTTKKVAPETVQIGDVIIVKPGEKIPLDGMVIEGDALLDTSALTGEAVPRRASVADNVLSGCVNQNSVLTIKVTQTFGQSTASKIIDLVENAANKKAPTEKFITKFAKYYTPVVVGFALVIAVIPPLLFNGVWFDWISRGLLFLVISCPCALVISIPLSFFGGIGSASKKGVLIKGGNYLEALNNLDLVVFDKTGTLTKGTFKITAIQPENEFTAGELLETVASAEAFSNHPIALSILHEYGKAVDKNVLSEYREIAGHGVSVNANGRTIFAGNKKLMDKMGIATEETPSIGTKVHVVVDGLYVGCVVISDEIKPDSYIAITELKALGVRKTVMLTGDNQQTAEAFASELRVDEVFGSLLPQHKVEKVEILNGQKRANGTLAFIGDGLNDAPVLAMADVGVAMGGLGSDAAIEAADVVIMTDEPSKLVEAIKVARFTKRVVWQNIVFALGVKSLFLLLGVAGIATMWEAVFADVGVTLLAVLNAMRVMKK
ncbi:MAG: cadmium-translocating P-type ATPase [Candidatus Bathyarchaeota archaeon]|nr:cadmium-translocating P-type ATPase [Candidatus Termiticorpusculum sp.]MCL2258112.1 cadmium-translocating P-type ATPase [Candidatus Termiticorpusculum sp.]MCL2291630.1 cadmium-translocating P-type ATPase [Candidatus Termiticorpusculum sp.]